jgi:2,5-diamino-6-(ribosylamino)-4(3H)-pyrimidinone 5'-phosphate reductase
VLEAYHKIGRQAIYLLFAKLSKVHKTKVAESITRPNVIINCAMSADGKISSVERSQVRISGQADLARVDLLRAESDAVMVGVGTVLADDPSLRVKSAKLHQARREKGWPENPLRIIADSRARTPSSAKVLGPGCILAVTGSASQERLDRLSSKCEIIVCGKEQVDLQELFSRLFDRGIKRIMVEGGATLNWSLLKLGLVDELYVYMGAMLICGESAPTLADGQGFKEDFPRLILSSVERLDEGVLLKWTLQSGKPGRS